jgi:hypothetical protein
MKESGINYFYTQLGLDTGSFKVFYTFEEGAGTQINSIPSGDAFYTGFLSSDTNFWIKPGSGYSSGNYIEISNASGLYSPTWTQIFVYEKLNTLPAVLFSSLTTGSGYAIGLTDTNKPYLESFNTEPIIATFGNNLGSKNAISISYQVNSVTIGCYNFTNKTLEAESYDYPFEIKRSDDCKLFPSYTGYCDYYIQTTDFLSPTVIGQLLSGLYARKTGVAYETESICTTGITGYQNVYIVETGVTGRIITPGGDEGRDYFTGAFPTTHSVAYLTGIISTGYFLSGITGVTCEIITGAQTDLLEVLTGYASSFGLDKVQLYSFIQSTDMVKDSYSFIPFDDNYNDIGFASYSGFQFATAYTTGGVNLFWNGIAQANEGWTVTGFYIFVSGASAIDGIFLDSKSGDHKSFYATGQTGIGFTYSGQEIFLNGINLVSGVQFIVNDGQFNLLTGITGTTGVIFEYPIVLNYNTGTGSVLTGLRFSRDTSNIYINGVRQQLDVGYVEGGLYDLLSGNYYNPANVQLLYNNTDSYWE